jgi:hypothetical protein
MILCLHRDYSFPLKLAGEQSAHVTCRGCKRRIVYDWQAMRIVSRSVPGSPPEAAAPRAGAVSAAPAFLDNNGR